MAVTTTTSEGAKISMKFYQSTEASKTVRKNELHPFIVMEELE